jgi:hypothetical protein
MLILIPFIITIVFVAISVSAGDFTDAENLNLYVPDNYHNMTVQERIDWLDAQHGGGHTRELVLEFSWFHSWNPFNWLWHYEYTFTDGTKMDDNQYNRFINGNGDDPDYLAVTLSILSINPPALEQIGIWGLMFRIILIVAVCIGIANVVIP